MRIALITITTILCCHAIGQPKKTLQANAPFAKPKLVVGIVIDQMRWDYLYRFQPIFKTSGGFRRMMDNGYSCDNTMIPYAPTVTACGHTCVYTGSVPNIHGITGNSWWDKTLGRTVYCSEDKTVDGVGGKDEITGQMSPRNMFATTIGDELKLSNNFKSKVVGVAIKDRGAILPAGHSANAAYWFDAKSGNFITSTYYMDSLPTWVNNFNNKKMPDSMMQAGWQKGLPDSVYLQYADADAQAYEVKPFGKDATQMPYKLIPSFGEGYSKILTTPWGNTLTAEMAKATIMAEQLGKGSATDFLAISFSSPDYIGHAFGPNSWEIVDNYLKLDEELGKLFAFLDKQLGACNYISFLTADHAVAHIPGFLKQHHLPGGVIDDDSLKKALNKQLKQSYNADSLVLSMYNYQVTLNQPSIKKNGLDKQKIINDVIANIEKVEGISSVFPVSEIMTAPINSTLREMLVNGYYANRCGDIEMVFKPGYIEGKTTGTTHGLWYPYDAHIPLLWYGWGIPKGNTHRPTYMTDIAATLAALLHIQMPSGCVGKVIGEVVKPN